MHVYIRYIYTHIRASRRLVRRGRAHSARVKRRVVVGVEQGEVYRGTSFIRNSGRLGPYSRTMPRVLWQP